MTTAPLRVALIGAGRVARVHAAALSGLAEARLVAVADPRRAAAEELARLSGCAAYGSAQEAIERERPEAAVVCAPTHCHAALARQLLTEGVHVLCEKPLALDLAEAAAMVAAARSAGRLLVLATKFRFVPGVVLAKKLLDVGSLGDPERAEITFAQRLSMAGHWYSDPAASGGGALADNGPHAADLLRFLFGPVTAVLATEGPRPQALAVEEAVTLEARAGDGVTARVDLSWNADGGETYLRVGGSDGELEIGWKACRCRTPGATEWTPLAPGYDRGQAFRAMHQSFARAARGRGAPEGSTEDAFASAVVVAAAYASLARPGWVQVQEGI